MKDGRTHLAYKAEHVVDLDTELILAAEVYHADTADVDTIGPSISQAQDNLMQGRERGGDRGGGGGQRLLRERDAGGIGIHRGPTNVHCRTEARASSQLERQAGQSNARQ